MIQMGEYKAGTDPVSDAAVQRQPQIQALLSQKSDESVSMGETMMAMAKVVG